MFSLFTSYSIALKTQRKATFSFGVAYGKKKGFRYFLLVVYFVFRPTVGNVFLNSSKLSA